jgi:tripartite-type tricarboxylate transporter receptor subunit TctC
MRYCQVGLCLEVVDVSKSGGEIMWASRRKIVRLFAGIVACVSLSAADSFAQSYPVKPVRLVVGFTPGGVADAIGRLLAQKLSEPLGQQVIVENRGGASGAIAYEMVAKSPADGYTLLIIGATAAVLPALRARLPYDLERDFAPVSLVAIAPFVLVIHPSVPAHNVKELVALARSQPGKLSYGSVGAGSPPHLMAELFKLMANVDIVHVPYKGGAENAIANASGQVEMSFLSVPSLLPLLGANRVKPLAITGIRRASFMPSLPTLDESGLRGYDYSNWNGVTGPAGLPKDIVARLNAMIAKVVETPDVKESLGRQGLEPQTSTPEHFAAFIHGEVAKNAKLIKLIGMKAE